jgi:nucleoside-diphosphate-sugar epimerase
MRILLTGATGFVGRHVLARLAHGGHEVIAVSRSGGLETGVAAGLVRHLACDLHGPQADAALDCEPDVLIHLAWPGLPNYQQSFHFERNLPGAWQFLRRAVERGVGHLVVAGTGAEFGMMSGELDEEAPTAPVNAYGIAKDALRRCLQHLQRSHPFVLQWVRLFHMFGPGQNPSSLLAQLDTAIERNAVEFAMSGGEQLRDYLPVEEVARRIVLLAGRSDVQGIIHCGSGRPVSIRHLAETHITQRGATIGLRLGVHPYPDYEPMAYWGRLGKLAPLLAAKEI